MAAHCMRLQPDAVPPSRSVAAVYNTHNAIVSAGGTAMLRSVKDLHYYGLHATDGNMGVVYSVLFEELTWTVRYLVVDTGTWLPGRQVLIAPISLGAADWETQRISVKLTTDQIKNSPSID